MNFITGAPLERRARGNWPRCPPLNPTLSGGRFLNKIPVGGKLNKNG